jgi:protein-tyrosine phosphatase
LRDIYRICFVCTGNIIRSPLAENLFCHHAQEREVSERFEIDSAGTGSWHIGEAPDTRICQVAARRGIEMSGCARQFSRSDFDRFDLILVMDRQNYEVLSRLAPNDEKRAKIRFLREFDPQGGKRSPVPDPYYEGRDGFEEVFQIVDRSIRGLLNELEAEQARE